MIGTAEAVLASTGAAVLLVDPDGTVVSANPAAADLLGTSPGRLVGRDAAALLARPREVREMRLALRSVARTGTRRAHETCLPGPGPAAWRGRCRASVRPAHRSRWSGST